MRIRHGVLAVLGVLLIVLADEACSNLDVAGPELDEPSFAREPPEVTPLQSIDAAEQRFTPTWPAGRTEVDLYRIGTTHSAFAGLHLDETGLVVSVTDTTRAAEILAALAPFKRDFMDARGMTALDTRIRLVDYGYRELSIWKEAATRTLLADSDVHWADFDEVENRVVIGVRNLSQTSGLKNRVADWVPRNAIQTKLAGAIRSTRGLPATEPTRSASHQLGHYFQPVPGGVGVTGVVGTGIHPCSFGFTARWGGSTGDLGFVTASHCAGVTGTIDTPSLGQLGQSQAVGTEQVDPRNSCGDDCVWADAAWYEFVSGRSGELATIAMTESSGRSTGSKIIGSNTRFDVDGQWSNPVVGDTLQKMGNNQGWTWGTVTRTCVDTTRDEDEDGDVDLEIRCQDAADYGHARGDSGGPVFVIVGHPNAVRLMGIHIGHDTNTDEAYLSAMANIEVHLSGDDSFQLFVGPALDDDGD